MIVTVSEGQPQMPITTGIALPGLEIRENLGVCFGLVVRSMGLAKSFTAGFFSFAPQEQRAWIDNIQVTPNK